MGDRKFPGKLSSVSITQPSFSTFIIAAIETTDRKNGSKTYEAEVIPVLGIQSRAIHWDDQESINEVELIEQEEYFDFVVFSEGSLNSWHSVNEAWYEHSPWKVITFPPYSSNSMRSIINTEAQELIWQLKQNQSGCQGMQVGEGSWIPEKTEMPRDEPAKAVT